MKERRQVELNMYRERQEMIRNLKQYESDLKQHEASIKAMGEVRAKAQAAEDSKIAARLALGQRVSSRDRGTFKIEKLKFSKLCTILVVIIVKIIFFRSILF